LKARVVAAISSLLLPATVAPGPRADGLGGVVQALQRAGPVGAEQEREQGHQQDLRPGDEQQPGAGRLQNAGAGAGAVADLDAAELIALHQHRRRGVEDTVGGLDALTRRQSALEGQDIRRRAAADPDPRALVERPKGRRPGRRELGGGLLWDDAEGEPFLVIGIGIGGRRERAHGR
jgi:hypothetical protein